MKFSGFMNVYLLDDMSWEYQFADRSLKAATLTFSMRIWQRNP